MQISFQANPSISRSHTLRQPLVRFRETPPLQAEVLDPQRLTAERARLLAQAKKDAWPGGVGSLLIGLLLVNPIIIFCSLCGLFSVLGDLRDARRIRKQLRQVETGRQA
jgi:hypothetical protein